MKSSRVLLPALFLSLSVVSCYQGEDENSLVENSSSVTFRFNAMGVTREAITRAAISEPGNLLVLDCFDGKVKAQTQTSLSELPMPLEYGHHDLYFVAATNVWSSYNTNDLTVTWGSDRTSMTYVWGAKLSLDVAAGTPSQEVQLPLVVADVNVSTLDYIPAGMGEMRVESADACRGLKLTDMTGFVSAPVDYRFDCSPFAGMNRTLEFNLFTFVPSSGSIGDVQLTAYQKSNASAELASQTLSDVQVAAGYVSRYSGYFFSDGVAIAFSYADDWLGTHSYGY